MEEKKRKTRSYSDLINHGVESHCDVCTKEDRRLVSTQVVNERTGFIGRKSEYKTINREEEMKNYRVADFSLTNLLAIGADIKECGPLLGNRFESVANMESHIRSIESSINNDNNE